MAIPLYVPEEYGPSPMSSSSPSPSQNQAQVSSTLTQPENCASFVHQLIMELCSIYNEYSAAGNPNLAVLPSNRDVNNNSTGLPLLPPTSHRRRRHPAGDTGLLCSPYEMVPLPALMQEAQPAETHRPPHEFQFGQRRTRSEYECKLSIKTSLGSIGFQLRQIADSYTISSNQPNHDQNDVPNNANNDVISKSEPGPTVPVEQERKQTSWCCKFAFVTSILFLSMSVTATVAWFRNK